MKAPRSKAVRDILSNPEDAKAYADAVRKNENANGEVVITLPSGRKVKIKKLSIFQR
jgi:hypothetical protein